MSEGARHRRRAVGTFVDEIGIEIGIYGDWRLKAAYAPVFAQISLGAVAVRGSVRPFLFGRETEAQVFRRAVPACDRPAIAVMSAVLALRNLEHTGVAGLKVILDADLGPTVSTARIRAAARALAAEISRNGLAPADVLVDMTRLAGADEDVLQTAVGMLRSGGIGVALRERGEGIPLAETALAPDVIMIDGDWFRAVARQASTAQLFGALVRGYRAQGATVLVNGIATAGELRAALGAEADWLSGPLLSPSALAGAVFPEEARPAETLLGERRVIPLFR